MPRDDEHAPSNIQLGQKFTEEVVRALLASPLWPRSVLFLTYDEHGGFYDHVPPPAACLPDDIPPERESGDVEGAFDRYGFRVPLIAVSPYARRGHVSHFVSSAASVLRFVETRFSLPAMTARDANAEPLLDLFDFERPDLTVPDLPAAALDPDERARCLAAYPDQG
jgi:phospholipase C